MDISCETDPLGGVRYIIDIPADDTAQLWPHERSLLEDARDVRSILLALAVIGNRLNDRQDAFQAGIREATALKAAKPCRNHVNAVKTADGGTVWEPFCFQCGAELEIPTVSFTDWAVSGQRPPRGIPKGMRVSHIKPGGHDPDCPAAELYTNPEPHKVRQCTCGKLGAGLPAGAEIYEFDNGDDNAFAGEVERRYSGTKTRVDTLGLHADDCPAKNDGELRCDCVVEESRRRAWADKRKGKDRRDGGDRRIFEATCLTANKRNVNRDDRRQGERRK